MFNLDLPRALVLGAVAASIVGTGPVLAAPRFTPDFSGFWILDRSQSTGLPKPARAGDTPASAPVFPPVTGDEPVPVRAELVPAMRAMRKHNDDNHLLEFRTQNCLPPNGFDAMTWPEPIDIVQRDDELAIIPERERSLVRHIYIGGEHPKQSVPSITGNSVARWEGDTLVVDTVGLDTAPALFASAYLPHSGDLRAVERIHLGNGGKTLFVQWRFTDPQVLTASWTVNAAFNRGPADMEHVEAVCDVENRGLEPRK